MNTGRTGRRLPFARAAAAWLAALSCVCGAQPGGAPAGLASAGATGEKTGAPAAKRPRICLVLSGGGARGAAHVGVIRVLEEQRVPISCIAGTSMGALIGAAYATGTSIDEMQRMTSSITTKMLFHENPPRQEQSMRRKGDDYLPFVGPEVGAKDGKLKLPKGVVTGVQLETVLRELSKAKGYYRFDKLPIPFRAVATDLVTGKAVVFQDGELADVMRASMSVPGAVAPAEFRGMMLVDGMLAENLPVRTAREELDADVIIAVNVGTPLMKRDELDSILGITGQMLSILTEQNVQASLAMLGPGDVLITPELESYSTGDFDVLASIVPRGEEAARKVAGQLARFSIPPDEYAALRARQTIAVLPDTRPVDEIRFVDLKRVNPEAAARAMETKPGEPIDQAKLDGDMRRLYGTGDFEHVNYRYLEEPGRRVLVVDAVEKSWGPDYLRMGLGLSTDFSGDAFFNLLASYRKTWINHLGAEWRTDLQIGRTSSLITEFYQPLNSTGSIFVAPRLTAERRSAFLYQGDTRVASYDVQSAFAGLDVGYQFRQLGSLRVGLQRGVVDPRLDTGPPVYATGVERASTGAATARLTIDQIDSPLLPRSGWRVGASAYDSLQGLGADFPYVKWDVDFTAAYSIGENTFGIAGKRGGKIGSNPLPNYDQFSWGGFLQGSGYRTGQLYGDKLEYARAMYYRQIMKGSLFEGAYGGVSLEVTRMSDPLVAGNPDGWLKSMALFVAADTLIGKAWLGYGRAVDGNQSMYFYLGRPF